MRIWLLIFLALPEVGWAPWRDAPYVCIGPPATSRPPSLVSASPRICPVDYPPAAEAPLGLGKGRHANLTRSAAPSDSLPSAVHRSGTFHILGRNTHRVGVPTHALSHRMSRTASCSAARLARCRRGGGMHPPIPPPCAPRRLRQDPPLLSSCEQQHPSKLEAACRQHVRRRLRKPKGKIVLP